MTKNMPVKTQDQLDIQLSALFVYQNELYRWTGRKALNPSKKQYLIEIILHKSGSSVMEETKWVNYTDLYIVDNAIAPNKEKP